MHDGPLAARGRYHERRRTAAALPHRHQPRPPRCVALCRQPAAAAAERSARAPPLRLASLAERDAPPLQVERVAVPVAERCIPVHDFSSCLTADARRACGLATPIVLQLLAAGRLEGHEPEGRQAGSRRPAAGPARRGAEHHRRPAWRHTQWRVCGVVEHRDVKRRVFVIVRSDFSQLFPLSFLSFPLSFLSFPCDFSQIFTFFNHVSLSFFQGQARVRPASRQARRDDEFRFCLKFDVGERWWVASGRAAHALRGAQGPARKRGCGAALRVAGGGRRGGVRQCLYFNVSCLMFAFTRA